MANLDNTKEGDFVAFERYRNYPPVRCVVVRATKTRLFVEAYPGATPQAFNRRGYVPGNGTYSTPCIEPWDDNVHPQRAKKIKDESYLHSMRYSLRDFNWRGLEANQCKVVIAALKKLGIDVMKERSE